MFGIVAGGGLRLKLIRGPRRRLLPLHRRRRVRSKVVHLLAYTSLHP